jgi:hypothetical protein
MYNSPTFRALAREAGLSGELLAAGVTLLGKANYAQDGYYNQAFFNLSIGLERLCKLCVVLDYKIENGVFPTDDQLRARGHNLKMLMSEANRLSEKYRKGQAYSSLPDSEIHSGIIDTLSDFAMRSRYYNLDYLVGGKSASGYDPLHMWHDQVGKPILAKHYQEKQRLRDEANARVMQTLMGDYMFVLHTKETGETIDSVEDAAYHASQTKLIQKFGQLYTLQIIRFGAHLIWDIEMIAHSNGLDDVPFLHEFFSGFYNDDTYFRSRKTWSIYRP